MGAILFLISIFSPFELDINNNYLNSISQNQDLGIEVEFTAVPHLSVGDPVLFKGQQVGSVSKVEIPYSSSEEYQLGKSKISIKLNELKVPVNDHLVALVAKVKMPIEGISRPAVRSVLELIQLSDVSSDKSAPNYRLHGFTSFEEFWNSNSKNLPNA